MYDSTFRFHNQVEKKAKSIIGFAMVMSVLSTILSLGFVGAVIWVAYHFLSKVW